MGKGKIIYSAKVREANRNYEFNNNGCCDNGVLITENGEKLNPH
jgi:hypothetical protein